MSDPDPTLAPTLAVPVTQATGDSAATRAELRSAAQAWDSFPPRIRERYRPRGLIGEGGMGIVLEAEDLEMGRTVAIKGIRDVAATSPELRERFEREVRLQSRLAHPNILPVFDVWQDGAGAPWCSMLRVPDRGDLAGPPTLGTLLEGSRTARSPGERPIANLLQIFLQICRGVGFAHSAGIIHRDLKPDNVLLGPSGEAMVADWGLAFDRRVGTAGDLAGTPAYAAPEQMDPARFASTDERADVHGLGAILLELVTGRAIPVQPGPPFGARDATDPVPANRFDRHVPRELVEIIRRACHPDPALRYPDVATLRRAVEDHLDGGLVEGMRYSARERVQKWIRRNPALAALVASGAILGTLLVLQRVAHAQRLEEELANTQKNLALTKAEQAAALASQGFLQGARIRAAEAFHAAREVPGWRLPRGRVHPLFHGLHPRSPVVWSRQLEAGEHPTRFSADGSRLLVAQDSNHFLEFRLGSRDPPRISRVPGGTVQIDDFSPDGRLLARERLDGATEILSMAAMTSVTSVKWTGTTTPEASFLDPSRILIRSSHTLEVRELPSGRLLGRTPDTGKEIWSVTTTPGADRFALADREGVLRIFSPDLELELGRIDTGRTAVLAMQILDGGKKLLTAGGDSRLRVWEVAGGIEVEAIGEGLANILCMARSPDGRLLATGDQEWIVTLWDLSTRRIAARLPGHQHWVWRLAFSPDGRFLASVDQENTLFVWDVGVATRPPIPPEDRKFVQQVVDIGDTAVVLAHDQGDTSTLRTLDLRTADEIIHRRPYRIDLLARQDTRLLTLTRTDSALLLGSEPLSADPDAVTSAPSRVLPDSAKMTFITIAPDASVVGGISEDGRCRAWDPATLSLLREVAPSGPELSAIGFSTGARRMACGRADGSVIVLELSSGKIHAELAGPTGVNFSPRVTCLAFTGEQGPLLIGDGQGDVRVWHPERAGAPVERHHLIMSPITTLALEPRGRFLFAGGGQGMGVLDRTELRLCRELAIEDDPVMALAIGRQGECLIAGASTELRLLELPSILDPGRRITEILADGQLEADPVTGRVRPLGSAAH